MFDLVVLVGLVMATVELVKKFGLTGNVLLGVSTGLGMLFGILYQFSIQPPVTFEQWFYTVCVGLGVGLTASGVYDIGASWAKKAATTITDKQE